MKLLRALRTELIAAVLALLIASFFALHVVHFSHRNDAERTVWTGLPLWQTLEAFEYRLYDARFVAAYQELHTDSQSHQQRSAQLSDIVIVGVDEGTLSRIGAWPIARRHHAALVQRLKRAGARVIILDFDFSQPQNAEDDSQLAASLRDAGNVLLPSYLTTERLRGDLKSRSALVHRTTTPLEQFDEWTPDLSLAYVPLDSDGHVRRYPLYASINDAAVGSFAALAAASWQGLLDNNENERYERALTGKTWPTRRGDKKRVPVVSSGTSKEDAPQVFTTPLHFWGPARTFRTYSYADVLLGREGEYSDRKLKKNFGGKIVFVGATTHILKDVFSVPQFESVGDRESDFIEGGLMPGVELHATATAMLLDGSYIRGMSTQATLWLLFGLTIGASLWAASLRNVVSRAARGAQVLWTRLHMRSQIHTTVWFGLYLILGALPIYGFWYIANEAFQNQNLWIVVAYPGLSATIATGVVLLFLFGSESAERRKTESHFSRVVSPEVIAKMLASGEDYLAPEQVCVTVLFTDLEGFTTYSESHPPQQVIDVTNDFLSHVVPVIYKHGGWVDKYIGDAIMAVFGPPLEYSDHARRALRCAVEMQDEAAKWRKKTGIGFYMRAGIHTGEVIAGYMGSRSSKYNPRPREDYTVIGDTVNLASRLEGKNKEFHSWIMCSAHTFEAAPDVVAAKRVSAPIKGKSKEVEVYIVHGLKDDPERDKNWAKEVS